MKVKIKLAFVPGELSAGNPYFKENHNYVKKFIELPGQMAVCWRCDGLGRHVNPSIDGNGISPEEFYDDPDFAEGYFGGRYDIVCEICNGRNVIGEVNEAAFSDFDKEIYKRHLEFEEADRQIRAEHAAELRMGA